MQQSLLEKVRKINRIVQSKEKDILDFNKLCCIVGDVTDSTVFFIDANGKVFCKYIMPFVNAEIKIDQDGILKEDVQKLLWSFVDTRINLKLSEIAKIAEIESEKVDIKDIVCTIIPIIGGTRRFGTVLSLKSYTNFTEDDVILLEYVATIIGLDLLNLTKEEDEEEKKKREMIKSAIDTLSISELEALIHIFEELKTNEGLLVASKIADKVGITRSVIVNALRKFESAGLIETRSLGLKGTYIKVLNDMVRSEIEKYKEKLKVK
ncbi:GTP-sensing pleiotropic transcriptional regulator CodY [Caldicellulosiruptor naganoensis]|uniref:Global transcriptional regulator CodY n=1 Tax=Caldicellulosiruptor naganoensis TaxID=29324 RepID=A0ABY7BGZ1_9FIRM|nr:GTP-sensing pleiotropic transcriptional regulator CodY [Caldicellulosiruptor naganoensis]WAM32095.1 GTP-sensing pleiotropic transcriptional regulator CodY [Caldicellulosiruptor naganoensis]